MKKSKRVLSLLLSVLMILGSVAVGLESFNLTAFAAEDATKLKADANGDFKILQVADIQDCWRSDGSVNVWERTIEMIEAAVMLRKPDLIVMTGDNIGPEDSKDRLTTERDFIFSVQKIVDSFHGVPFVVTFGNHDYERNKNGSSSITLQRQEQIYHEAGALTLNQTGLTISSTSANSSARYGTGYLDVYDSTGTTVIERVIVLNSGSYEGSRSNPTQFGRVGVDVDSYQNKDYQNVVNAVASWTSDANIKCIAFQHMPIQEMFYGDNATTSICTTSSDGWSIYPSSTSRMDTSAKYVKNSSNPTVTGEFHENAGQSYGSTVELFNALANKSNVAGLFFGHEHTNTVTGVATVGGKTLRMGYGGGCLVYSDYTGDSAYSDNNPLASFYTLKNVANTNTATTKEVLSYFSLTRNADNKALYSNNQEYISDVRLFAADTAGSGSGNTANDHFDEAVNKCIAAGYTPLDKLYTNNTSADGNVFVNKADFNFDSYTYDGNTGAKAVCLGYKTSTDPNDAITDIRIYNGGATAPATFTAQELWPAQNNSSNTCSATRNTSGTNSPVITYYNANYDNMGASLRTDGGQVKFNEGLTAFGDNENAWLFYTKDYRAGLPVKSLFANITDTYKIAGKDKPYINKNKTATTAGCEMYKNFNLNKNNQEYPYSWVQYLNNDYDYAWDMAAANVKREYTNKLRGSDNQTSVWGFIGMTHALPKEGSVSGSFLAPEVIYLNPSDEKNFEYFVNDCTSEYQPFITAKNNETAGYFVFEGPEGATITSVTCTGATINGKSAGANLTGSGGGFTVNGNKVTGTISSGSLPGAADQKSSTTLTWTVTYTVNVNGETVTQIATAYTECYAPYATAIATASKVHTNHGTQVIVWLEGVHSYSTARNSLVNPGDSATCQTEATYYGELKVTDSAHYFDPMGDGVSTVSSNTNIIEWFTTSAQTGREKTIYYGESTIDNNKKKWNSNMVTGYTALLNVDSSRYTNLNQIPNLQGGAMCPDYTEGMGSVVGLTSVYYNGYEEANDTFHNNNLVPNIRNIAGIYNSDNKHGILASGAIGQYSWDVNNTDSISFAYASEVSDKKSASGITVVRYNCAAAYQPIVVTKTDKSKLREAYLEAISSGRQAEHYTASSWAVYEKALKDVAKNLETVTVVADDSLVTALNNAIDGLVPHSVGFDNMFFAKEHNFGGQTNGTVTINFTGTGSNSEATIQDSVFLDVVPGKTYLVGADMTFTAGNGGKTPSGQIYLFFYDANGNAITPAHTDAQKQSVLKDGESTTSATPGFTGNGYHYVTYTIPSGCYKVKVRFDCDVSGAASGDTATAKYENIRFVEWNDIMKDISYSASEKGVPYGSDLSGKLITPTKPGYNFVEWNTKQDGTGERYINSTEYYETVSTPLYSQWSMVDYNIEYELDGGSATNITSYNIETPSFTLNNPTKTGYTFAGWTLTGATFASGSSTSGTTAKVAKGTYGNITAAASWTINQYPVTFDAQGHGTAPAQQNVNYNGTVTKPEDLTATGYTFGGWYKEAACTNLWDFANDKVTGNTTLYAKWTVNQYTVTFDAQGHGTAPASQTVNYNGTASKPADLSATGYTFGGWYKEAACTNAWNFSTDKITGNTTIYAKWTINQYTVTFDAQGHGTAPAQQTVNYNGTATKPADLSAAGYTFGGWYKEAACTNAWNFGTDKITGNTTIYAKWTINQYSVDFNVQGHGTAPASQTVNYNGTAAQPTAPTANGYTFGGWFKEAACTNAWNFGTDKITGNTTIYAKWTPVTYTVTYNLDGGTASGNPATYNIETATFTLSNPTKTGYTFAGWTLTGATFAGGSATSGKTATVAKGTYGNITATASWTVNTYTVSFNANGHGTAPASKTADYNTTVTAPTAPTATGYTFGGWYKEAACTNAWNFSTDKVTDNVTLYAKWTINKSTLIVKPNGLKLNGSTAQISYENKDYGSTVDLSAIKVETVSDEQIFNGWEITSGTNGTLDGSVFTFGAADKATVTVTAKIINAPFVTAEQTGTTSNTVTVGYAASDVLPAAVDGITSRSIINNTGFTPAINWSTATTKSVDVKNTYSGGTKDITSNVKFYPETNVLYEETAGTATNGAASWSTVSGTKGSAGNSEAKLYGYTNAYANDNAYSNGTAYEVTVGEGQTSWPSYSFTFTGTAFDINTRCDTDTGLMTVKVYPANDHSNVANLKEVDVNNNHKKASKAVNTIFRDGKVLYQTPTAHLEMAEYGTYDVVVSVAYSKAFDPYYNKDLAGGSAAEDEIEFTKKNGDVYVDLSELLGEGYEECEYEELAPISEKKASAVDLIDMSGNLAGGTSTANEYSVCIDSIRVYNPAGVNLTSGDIYTQYNADNELNPTYTLMRSTLLTTTKTATELVGLTGSVYIEANAIDTTVPVNTYVTSTYKDKGSGNEIYLTKGSGIGFGFTGELSALHIALRSPTGEHVTAFIGDPANPKTINIDTATEMYYDVLDCLDSNGTLAITVDANSAGMLAIGECKTIGVSGSEPTPHASPAALAKAAELVAAVSETSLDGEDALEFTVNFGDEGVATVTCTADRFNYVLKDGQWAITVNFTEEEIEELFADSGLSEDYTLGKIADTALVAELVDGEWVTRDVTFGVEEIGSAGPGSAAESVLTIFDWLIEIMKLIRELFETSFARVVII